MPDLLILDQEEQKKLEEKKVEHHVVRPLSYFCLHPDGIEFETQEAEEVILLFLRKHWVTNTPWILVTLLASLLPFLFHTILGVLHYEVTLPPMYVTLAVAFYFLLIFSYMFLNFITWFYNISLITNKRLVDIDYSDLVYRHVSATKLELIQDVSYTQVGVLRSIFDYGNLMVQTAAAIDNFEFDQAPHPEDVIRIIESLIGKIK